MLIKLYCLVVQFWGEGGGFGTNIELHFRVEGGSLTFHAKFDHYSNITNDGSQVQLPDFYYVKLASVNCCKYAIVNCKCCLIK